MSDGLKTVFSPEAGLCNQNGKLAIERSAPVDARADFFADLATGSTDIQASAKQTLPVCKNPETVSAVTYKPPKR